MRQYLDIVKNVLDNGVMKGNRTGTRALTTFCEIFRHDMTDGFPLLTTKKMYTRGVAVELEGFIGGITDKKWYQERKCRIWDSWGNPEKVEQTIQDNESPFGGFIDRNSELAREIQKEEMDLGPIYGYQWRHFDEHYGDVPEQCETLDGSGFDHDYNGVECGADQLKNVINTLKTNPDDRRMVVSAWNPNQTHLMALPPCHYAFTLVHINGVLNLSWKQRSVDTILGLSFNIASYALLLLLLCREANLIPGELVGILEDCHIYENQIDGAKEQLSRSPLALPTVGLLVPVESDFNIFNWTHNDIEILDYNSHPKIDFGPVAV